MPRHTNSDEPRQQLALTQQDLAMYLRISREQLGQVEIGRRSLPLVALQRLTPLLRVLYEASGGAARTEPPLTGAESEPAHKANAEVVDEVQQRLDSARYEVRNARYQLSLLQRQAPALRRRVLVLTTLQATLPAVPAHGTDDPDAWDRLWYKHHIEDAERKLTKCGRLPQGLLEARIQALDLEIAALEKLLPAPTE